MDQAMNMQEALLLAAAMPGRLGARMVGYGKGSACLVHDGPGIRTFRVLTYEQFTKPGFKGGRHFSPNTFEITIPWEVVTIEQLKKEGDE